MLWRRFVVFTFWSFLLSGLVPCRPGPVDLRRVEGSFPVHEEVSVVGLCCRLALCVLVSHVADCCSGTLGDFVVICTFLLFRVFCPVECAVDSDCSCWETPGRFLHHDMGRLIGRACRTSLPLVTPTTLAMSLVCITVSLQPQRGDSTLGRLFEHSGVSTRTVPFLTPCCLCELSLVATFITLASCLVCNIVSLVGPQHSSYFCAKATSLT